MRVDLSYKFIVGFLLVVVSAVLVGQLAPHLDILPEFQQLVSIACAIVVGLIIGVIFSRTLTANFGRVIAGSERISQGDLTTRIELNKPLFTDEVVDLANALNNVTHGLRELVGLIRNNSESVAVSAHSLSFTAFDMNNVTQEVATKVEQIAYGVDHQEQLVDRAGKLIREVSVLAELVAASAVRLSDSAETTATAAREGGEVVDRATETLRTALREIEQDTRLLAAFSARLKEVGVFVEMITGIANRTNLISFNAQSRADQGEALGDDYRKLAADLHQLAASTNDFTSEITLLLESISSQNHKMIESIAAITERVGEGRTALDATGRAFGTIVESAATTRSKAQSIVELAQQQREGVLSIVSAMAEIARITVENTAATNDVAKATGRQSAAMLELAQSAKYLNALAEELNQHVSRFRIEEGMPEPEETPGVAEPVTA